MSDKIPMTAVYPRFNKGGRIDFFERAVPEPGDGQLLIRCRANALCASDLTDLENGTSIAIGHENTGLIAKAGPNTNYKVGQKGVIFLMDFCGECRNCKMDLTNQCLHKRADYGFTHDGGYGPYSLVNQNVFFPVDDEVDLSEATMLLDVMGTGHHALKRAQSAHCDPGSILIMGAGPIGLGLAAMSRLIFGKDFPVFIADIIQYRLDLAEKLGAFTINLNIEKIETRLNDKGLSCVDIAVDSSGKTAARQQALKLLDKRGVLVCVGHGESLNIEISPDLIATERAILGSEYFCYSEIKENYMLFLKHRAYLSQIITHRFPVKEISNAYDLFKKRETGKVIIEQ